VSLLRRMTAVALVGGVSTGLLWFALQAVWVTPLVHRAETYETHAPGSASPAGADPTIADQPATGTVGRWLRTWTVPGGLERAALTAVSDALAAVGFALVLVAGMVLQGAEPSAGRGVLWGLAGYAAVMLAPALGLPPALPGAATAPLADRQLWWVGTVAATAAGLALLAFAPRWIKPAGVVLLVVPHAIGAPVPPLDVPELLPPALTARYAAAVLVTGAAFWAALGAMCAYLLRRATETP